MKITETQLKDTYTNILTTKRVNDIIEKQNKNLKLTLNEHIWFDRKVNVRKADLSFAMTDEEQNEYIKCKMDVNYFADKYCQIKREDGTIGPIKLRNYQQDIINLYKNRYSILLASRQLGKTISASITILHLCLFNDDKGAMIVANKSSTVIEIINKIQGIYKHIPFFLQKGIVNWNQSSITFDNGSRIKTDKRTKEPAVGFSIDLLLIDEFAHIPNSIINEYYTAIVPIVSSIINSRIIITSTPKGLNLFHKLFTDAELPHDDPNWNGYHALRIYWWQMKGKRDTKIFFNLKKLHKYNITIEQIKQFLVEEQGYKIYTKNENNIEGWFVEHDKLNENTNIDFIRSLRYNDLPLSELGLITNWQEQETKLIGGEDAFKQEYNLQFLTGDKMLFDSVTLEKMFEDRYNFEYVDIPLFNKKLNIPYNGLSFLKDHLDILDILKTKNYHIFMSLDLSEGLGNDYSIINIFRLMPKTKEEITIYKNRLVDMYDYFKLEQIGIFKTNVYSVEEVAHVLYMLAFELFDQDKVRIALERNTYGDELLAHIPHVFNDNNNYSNHVFLRYKHRVEEKTTKMGIKINSNKKILIKDYQNNTKKGNIVVHEQYTISEISTFTKHETPSGDITYRSENSTHDDTVMSCVVLSSVFGMVSYRDAVDEIIKNTKDPMLPEIKEFVDLHIDDKPDLTSFIGGYKKFYGNKPIQNNTNRSNQNQHPTFNGLPLKSQDVWLQSLRKK
jgi:hypothetical protein